MVARITTLHPALVLYSELTPAQIRAAQRALKAGELFRIVPGVLTPHPISDWPSLIARERIRVLAALYPGAVVGYASAFEGGVPVEGVMHLTYSYDKKVELPGLRVNLVKGPPAAASDAALMGRELYFPSVARVMLENLTASRGAVRKSVGRAAVETRLISICDARGEMTLNALRDDAKALGHELGLTRQAQVLDDLIGGILCTHQTSMATAAGRGMATAPHYDAHRIELFEHLAARLRASPMPEIPDGDQSTRWHVHFAFLESYFSNFIEGTEFEVSEARAFVLDGHPIESRPKDSHDILGVFRQALEQPWRTQALAAGEPVLDQLRRQHADMMRARPDIGPGEFKTRQNRAGSTEFVAPRLVRGTLIEGSKLLPSVPAGLARSLLAMFVCAEVHPFDDGNGRLARLNLNSELSRVGLCRIIVPTLFREEYLDCLRVLTREKNPKPYVDAMQKIQAWSAAFDYEDLDAVIALMKQCNAFEKSLHKFRLLTPTATTLAVSGHAEGT